MQNRSAFLMARCLLSSGKRPSRERMVISQAQKPCATFVTLPQCDVPPPPKCPSGACNEPRVGFFQRLFGGGKKPPPAEVKHTTDKPDIRCCRKQYCRNLKRPPADPDLSNYGGQAYKTCGIAYVIQRDRVPVRIACESREDRILREIETHIDLKKTMLHDDPVQETENLCRRQLEMADRGIHPLYKKLAETPPRHCHPASKDMECVPIYTTMDQRDLPSQIAVNMAALERKNIHFSLKRASPPGPLEGRTIEYKKAPLIRNATENATFIEHQLRAARRKDKMCKMLAAARGCDTTNANVFDTLNQKRATFYSECDPNNCKEDKGDDKCKCDCE